MARFIQGTCGLANIDNDDRIRAEDVTYDNSDGLYPPGTDNVQEALEAAGGMVPPAPAEMTPTVAGTAYGLQDTGTVSNLLGRDVNGAAVSSTGRYQAQISGTAQQTAYQFAIFDENHCNSDSNTTVGAAIVLANNSELLNCQVTDAIVEATNSLFNDTLVNNALVHGNSAELHDGATVRNDALYVNDSHLKGAQLDQACLHVTGLVAEGIPFDGAVMMGSMTNAAVTTMRESTFIGSNAGSVINQNGLQSLYLGNQSLGETITDREAWISSYDRFYLRTLRADAAPLNVCFYNAGTAEVTYGPPPAPILSTATISSAWFPVMYNPTTNVLAYANGTRISRVWRQQGTTDLNGSITFNPGGLITVNAANTAITATVVSTSTTIAYTCSISNIISGTFSIQVFQSTNAVLGSATMVRAGSGLVVHVTLAY